MNFKAVAQGYKGDRNVMVVISILTPGNELIFQRKSKPQIVGVGKLLHYIIGRNRTAVLFLRIMYSSKINGMTEVYYKQLTVAMNGPLSDK